MIGVELSKVANTSALRSLVKDLQRYEQAIDKLPDQIPVYGKQLTSLREALRKYNSALAFGRIKADAITWHGSELAGHDR